MVVDLSALDATGLVVVGWRSGEEGLRLHLRGRSDEVRLRCRCGRSHWIVRERVTPDGRTMRLTCHACGAHVSLLREGDEVLAL
jgi:hypothetical protein